MASSNDDKVSVPGFLGLLSTESSPVEIWANGLKFSIPRNYLETAAEIRAGGVFFRIVTSYPEFTGVTRDTFDQFHRPNWWRYPNTIVVHYTDNDAWLDRNQKLFKMSKESGEVVDADFDLKLWKQNPPNLLTDTFLNYREDVILICSIKPEVGSWRICHEWTTVEQNILFQIDYLRDQLPHWREIHRGVRSLIEKFRIKGESL